MRVLRVSHSAVVDAWRERERAVARRGVEVQAALRGSVGRGWLAGAAGPAFRTSRWRACGTLGSHPALFLYDPRPLWRALGEEWDVLDLHEEPFALATAEVLLLRALRGRRMPYLVYSAQNLDKRLPAPFRWLQRRVLDGAAAVSVCSTAAGEIVRRRGFPGRPDVVPLGVESPQTSPRELRARGRDHRVCGSARRPQGGRRPPRGRGRPERHGARGRGSRTGAGRAARPRVAVGPGRTGPLPRFAPGRGARRVLPGPRRSRGALADDRRVGRAVRPGRGRGHGLRRAGRRQRQWRPARRRR